MDTPLEECRRRDPKGLYERARQGSVAQMTGIEQPYEPPDHPDLVIPGASVSVEEGAARVLDLLARSSAAAGARAPRPPATRSAPGAASKARPDPTTFVLP